MGLDVVVWWDKNEGKWQVFEDSCPHRLAPLSEGRIDQWGRLQCSYHGWCFNGAGDCQFIPQAPPEGPAVHTSKRACVAAYPSIEHNKIVWLWPSTELQYKDVATKRKPPYIPEIDDPSFSCLFGSRDVPYGYEVMVENFMDPAHVDREGGIPLEVTVSSLDINGFAGEQELYGFLKFIPPCAIHVCTDSKQKNVFVTSVTQEEELQNDDQKKIVVVIYCIPVSPGRSRVIWTYPRNFDVWLDRIIPRWINHMVQLKVLDSDLMLIHLQEFKLREAGVSNWHKACYVPTSSDSQTSAFRKWLRKYSNGQIDWGTKFSGTLPQSLPKEQLMDRFSSHVVNCASCHTALKRLRALEIALKVIALATIGIVGAVKQNVISATMRIGLVCMALLCYSSSKWLSRFISQNFYFHDYNHAYV